MRGLRLGLSLGGGSGGVSSPILFRRPVFGWNAAGFDSARFGSFAALTDTTGLIAYSPRDDSKNDGEIGMRLDVVGYTLDVANETLTLGAPQTIATPTGYATGTGAMWQVQLLKLTTGRVLLFAQELNSPDGTYTHADSRYDLVMYYSDNDGATWSAKQVLLLGENAHTAFGLADYNAAAAGLHVTPGVNVAVQMASGRIVITGYLSAPAPGYLCSLYTDDAGGLTGWAAGAPLAYNSANHNEPSVALASDGSLIAFVRHETVNSRAIYRSTNGATWAFDREATEFPIRNVATAAYRTAGGKLLIGGATAAGDNRLGFKVFTSLDDGDTVSATNDTLFVQKQRIGYTFINQLAPGIYGALYEVTSEQAPGSFNRLGSLGLAVFNDAALAEGVAAIPLDSNTYDAATEYAAYAAYVAADGGTIGDAAACEAAIAAAIAGNYYSRLGFAVSARWGRKISGAATDKLYSLNRTFGIATGISTSLVLDTTTFAYPTLKLPDAGAFLTFAGVPIRSGSGAGAVLMDMAADTNAGNFFAIRWTDSVVHYIGASATSYIAPDTVTQGSPIYATVQGDVSNYFFDFDERMAIHGENGTDLQSVTTFPVHNTAGETADLQIYALAGANRHLVECWYFNGEDLSPDMVRQCGADVKARH